MKKFLSLFLALLMICGSIAGLVACNNDEIDIGSTHETQIETTDTDDTSDETQPPVVDIGGSVDQLKEANDKQAVLSEYGSLLVKEASYDASNAKKESEEHFYSMDSDGKVTLDAVWYDESGNVESRMNVLDGACYTQYGDSLEFSIIPDEDVNAVTMNLLLSEPWDNITSAVLTKDNGKIVMKLSRTVTYDIDDETASFTCIFTYRFNEYTLLIESYSYEYTENGASTRRVEVEYSYGAEYESNTDAYTAISGASETMPLTFVINPESDAEDVRNYTVAKDITVNVEDDADGNEYTLYKNLGCTADIEELWKYVSDFEDENFRLYVSIKGPQISFEYTLTEDDLTKYQQLLEDFVAIVLENSDKEAMELAYEKADDKYEYVVWQWYVGYMKYSEDQTVGIDAYMEANEIYNSAYLSLIETLKSIYESEAEYSKSIIFADWTEEELEVFNRDNSTIVDLNATNTELAAEAYSIMSQGMSLDIVTWDEDAVANIYAQMVANYNTIAELEGYDNYYEYASAEIYNRYYTAEERQTYRNYIKQYISPLYKEIHERYKTVLSSLSEEEQEELSALKYDLYSELANDYVRGYIDSYSGSMNEKMSAMLDGGLAVFGTGDNSPVTAYVNYSNYYEEPYAFFSIDYQDMMTVVHEMGHFISMYYINLSNTPYDTAETHSQGNEWMLLSYLDGEIDPEVYEALVLSRLRQGLKSVVTCTVDDEFEEAVYTAETPITDFEALVREIVNKYCGWDFYASVSTYNPYQYIQVVTTQSPVYYLNYSTSEIASLSFYIMASEDYTNAQEVYRKLQEEITPNKSLIYTVEEIGLLSPLDESTYQKICELFSSNTATQLAA